MAENQKNPFGPGGIQPAELGRLGIGMARLVERPKPLPPSESGQIRAAPPGGWNGEDGRTSCGGGTLPIERRRPARPRAEARQRQRQPIWICCTSTERAQHSYDGCEHGQFSPFPSSPLESLFSFLLFVVSYRVHFEVFQLGINFLHRTHSLQLGTLLGIIWLQCVTIPHRNQPQFAFTYY